MAPEDQRNIAWAVIVAAGAAIVFGGLHLAWRDGKRQYEAERATTYPSTVVATGWVYQPVTDAMSGEPGRSACTRSPDALDLGFPYGVVWAELCVRRTHRGGHDAYIKVRPRAIMICHAPRDCALPVRFDDAPIQTFAGAEADDGGSDIIFLESSERFARRLATSRRARIEVRFHDHGRQTFTFETAGLTPP